MREFKLNKWVAAGLMVSMPYAGVAHAAGLGRMNVLSQLGQPFAAEIDLVNVTKEELATLKANLAPPSAYQASNLQFNPALNALRLSVERRPNGSSYIKATSFRPVAEPYLDLLIELSWQGGKVVREYSALLDPPGMQPPAAAITAPAVSAPAVAATPAAPTVAQAAAPAVPPPAVAAPVPVAKPAPAPVPARAPAPSGTSASQYAVKYGDTLNGIAGSVRPEGVSLEQTLIGLFRANPDAFVNKNINQLRAGKILNVPEREQLAAVDAGGAAQEVRMHAANWHNYRRSVAAAAQPSMADAAPAAKGKITARVDDRAAPTGPRDVVVLSKGEPGAAGKGAADRVRALEEDLAARDKALAESKERIAQLEKTLKDMQKLAEIKNPGMAPAPQAAKAEPEKMQPPKVDAAKPEPAKVAEAPKVETPKAETPKAEAPKVEAPKVEPPKPVPPPAPKAAAPAPKVATPPPPEPGLMDTVMDNIVPIGGGLAALLGGLWGLSALRRRKQNAMLDEEPAPPVFKIDPAKASAPAVATADAALADATIPNLRVEPSVANVADTVDPIDEAQVYIDHGRDAQAEEILKEAMEQHPDRDDIPLKLLEVYAARGDKTAFNALAKDFHKRTGGLGDKWGRAAVMGYALDPGNALYPTTTETVDISASRDPSGAIDLDLMTGNASLPALPQGVDPMSTTTDILLERDTGSDVDLDKTMVLNRSDMPATPAEPAVALPDFNIELPEASTPSTPAAPAAPAANMLEFNLDLPSTATAPKMPAAAAPAPAAKAADAGLDFKVDFSGIDLNLDSKPADSPADKTVAAGGGAKDAQWEDVQQKFDLARAYQEMGDKDGAMEILHEVEREGDAEQKAEAKKLLAAMK